MKRKTLLFIICLMTITNLFAQVYRIPEGKQIYIPNDLKDNDFTDDNSEWSYYRMAYTDNIVVFWQKGFGHDLSNPPQLEGHDMSVDLHNLLEKLEYFYTFYRDKLKFVLPGSKSEKYRMMVMLNYSLEGTAYGGDYDGEIGALWISPNRVKDKTLNCIAHELGHSFQSQIMADGTGEAWGGGGIFEMTSQWMLWNVNPNWVTDENYHWKGFIDHFNKRFLDGENIYHSPYVLEYWSYKHGITVMGDLFRAGKRGEDPAMTYMRVFNLSLDQMADEMYDCYSRLLTFDFPRVKDTHKQYACELVTKAERVSIMKEEGVSKTLYTVVRPTEEQRPGTYGFNVIELLLNKKKQTVEFKGVEGDNIGYRYGIVLVDFDKSPTYLPVYKDVHKKFKFKPKKNTNRAFLVVVGCPTKKYEPFTWHRRGNDNAKEAEYPYEVILR